MPIIIPDNLPARHDLETADRISVINRAHALQQDIRAQEYAVLNLMPSTVKKQTERQLARLLGHTSLQVNLTLLRTNHHGDESMDAHLATFYKPWESVRNTYFDGLIVTGAPLGQVEWEDVLYWDELRRIIDWSREHVTARVFICWGALAALKHTHNIEKKLLPQKAFGVFPHTITDPTSPLIHGFDDEFMVPVSRHTELPREEIESHPDFTVVSSSDEAGLYIVSNTNGRDIYLMGHPEYGKSALGGEYERDRRAGKDISIPVNYFRGNDPSQKPVHRWRSHARMLYGNVLNYVYNHTPYDLEEIRRLPERLNS